MKPFKLFTLLTLFTLFTLTVTRYALDVYAGVSTTKHNLSTSGSGTIKASPASGVTEICVFCHTPHGAINPSDGPLWNHTLSSATYTVPSNSQPEYATMLSTVGQPDKGSKLCLSCHDGTVAIGLVVNTPGPGSSGSISMVGVTGDGKLPAGPTNLTTDISGHHPVSIAVNNTLKTDKDQQCIDVGIAFTITTAPTAPVRLRPTNNTYGGNPGILINGAPSGVQCASCHDAHDNTNGSFLLVSPASICSSCHLICP